MRNEKGFTLVELMVAFAVFSMLLTAAVAFYQIQSKAIAGSGKRKTAHEVTTAALTAIRKDIMQAGSGLRGTVPQAGGGERPMSHMAVYVDYHDAFSSSSSDKLYLNCTDYLDMSLPPGADYPNSFFVDAASPGIGKTWFELASGEIDAFVDHVHANVNEATMNKAIILPDTPGSAEVADLALSADGVVDPNTNTQTLKLAFSGTSSKRYAVPAISYEVAGDKLLRNGQVMIGGSRKSDQVPMVKVTDLKIRCQFKDSGAMGGVAWAQLDPSPGGVYTADKLVLVEVSLRYLVRDVDGGYGTPDSAPGQYRIAGDKTRGPWAIGGTRTISVSPRCLVLMQYL